MYRRRESSWPAVSRPRLFVMPPRIIVVLDRLVVKEEGLDVVTRKPRLLTSVLEHKLHKRMGFPQLFLALLSLNLTLGQQRLEVGKLPCSGLRVV